jgi:hypothetical protein
MKQGNTGTCIPFPPFCKHLSDILQTGGGGGGGGKRPHFRVSPMENSGNLNILLVLTQNSHLCQFPWGTPENDKFNLINTEVPQSFLQI